MSMQDKKTLGRREFTAASAMALLSGVAITVTGCGGSSSSPTSPSTPAPAPPAGGGGGDVTGTVGSNHGHTAVVTAAELASNDEVVLDIQGTSDHPHSVRLSVDELGMIAAGQRVSKESSEDAAHSHSVTFN
jgi:hypothetical protein